MSGDPGLPERLDSAAEQEDRRAVAQYEADKAAGEVRTVPHAEVRKRLGFDG